MARVLNAVCKFAELRGFVVQQGGSKALCGMSLECTEKGQRQASQALARIGITQDPTIAFPGQRVSISHVGYPYKWQIWSIIVPSQGTSDIHERILKIPLEFL